MYTRKRIVKKLRINLQSGRIKTDAQAAPSPLGQMTNYSLALMI